MQCLANTTLDQAARFGPENNSAYPFQAQERAGTATATDSPERGEPRPPFN